MHIFMYISVYSVALRALCSITLLCVSALVANPLFPNYPAVTKPLFLYSLYSLSFLTTCRYYPIA